MSVQSPVFGKETCFRENWNLMFGARLNRSSRCGANCIASEKKKKVVLKGTFFSSFTIFIFLSGGEAKWKRYYPQTNIPAGAVKWCSKPLLLKCSNNLLLLSFRLPRELFLTSPIHCRKSLFLPKLSQFVYHISLNFSFSSALTLLTIKLPFPSLQFSHLLLFPHFHVLQNRPSVTVKAAELCLLVLPPLPQFLAEPMLLHFFQQVPIFSWAQHLGQPNLLPNLSPGLMLWKACQKFQTVETTSSGVILRTERMTHGEKKGVFWSALLPILSVNWSATYTTFQQFQVPLDST